MRAIINSVKVTVIFLIVIYAPSLSAALCASAFPSAINSLTPTTGSVTFECGAYLGDNPSTKIYSPNLTVPTSSCQTTCPTGNCSSSGSAVTDYISYGSFSNTTSSQDVTISNGDSIYLGVDNQQEYDDITVYGGGTLNFSSHENGTVYKLDKLNIKSNATVNLVTGTYWIKKLLIGSGASITVSGSGTARLFVKNKLTIGSNAEINNNSEHLSTSRLLIVNEGNTAPDVTINSGVKIKGFIQTKYNLTIENNVDIRGAVTASSVTMQDGAKITYDFTALNSIDGSTFCEVGDLPEAPEVISDLPNCSTSFPGGLAAHDVVNPDAVVKFYCGAQLLNSPTSILTAERIINPSSSCSYTCETKNCTATGSPEINKLTYGVFQETTSTENVTANSQTIIVGENSQGEYYDITAGNNGVVNFSMHPLVTTIYKINNLVIESGGTINLVPGDYWIDRFLVDNQATVNVTGVGTARLFIRNKMSVGDNSNVNNSDEVHAASKLFIISRGEEYEDVYIGSDTTMKAFLYHEDDVIVQENTIYYGGIKAEDIDLLNNVKVYWDDADQLEGSTLCNGTDKSGVNHFSISVAKEAAFCQAETVVISALDSGNTVVTEYSNTVLLDTGTGKGTWSLVSGNGVFIDETNNDGEALYTFAESDQGIASFSLDYVSGDPEVTISVTEQYDSLISDNQSHGVTTYKPYGFLITDTEITNPIDTTTSFSTTQTAGVSDNLHITVYGEVQTDTCGIYESYNGNKNLNFWMSYSNPITGTKSFKVDNVEVGTSSSNPTSHTVNFIDGKAIISGKYNDVGKIQLHVSETISSTTISGQTEKFVVKPYDFQIYVPDNAVASESSGGIFKKSGEQFSISVSAMDSEGNITPNYGSEATPENVKVKSGLLVSPSNGNNGSNNSGVITNGNAFTPSNTPGVFSGSSFSFDEVGIIKLQASVASEDYLGAGNVESSLSENVGRFIPDHFNVTVNSPIITPSCSTFSYIGAKINYSTSPEISFIAKSANNDTLTNYTGEYFKIDSSGVDYAYSTNQAVAFNSSNSIITIIDNGNGTGAVKVGSGSGMYFNKSSGINYSPFDAEIQLEVTLTDDDGTTHTDSASFGGTSIGSGIVFTGSNTFYQGRIVIDNNFGSELLPLNIPVRVEYFNGDDFIKNTLDNCTVINSINVGLSVSNEQLDTTPTVNGLSQGQGSIVLSAPSTGQDGYVDVELDLTTSGQNIEYLQHDWSFDSNQDGAYDDNPKSRGTFGIYEGNDSIIFIKENY